MNKKISSQAKRILQYLESGNRLSQMEALRFGCFRLGARIWDLRQSGYNIQTELVTKNKKTFAEYYLV